MNDDNGHDDDEKWERAYVFELPPFLKLTADVIESVRTLPRGEMRYLVDLYYQMQGYRTRSTNQRSALKKDGEPFELIEHYRRQFDRLEVMLRRCMDAYADVFEVSRWAKRQVGIGPVLSAGLVAHIDITEAPTVGHIWRFAGLDPTSEWKKKGKLPWNRRLKVLAWKIGDSFMKNHNRPGCFYGKIYEKRKAREVERNEAGELAGQAASALERKNIEAKHTRSFYEAGKLPPAHIDQRAKRYATKLFLSHWHEIAYIEHYGRKPPACFALAELGHAHYIPPPP